MYFEAFEFFKDESTSTLHVHFCAYNQPALEHLLDYACTYCLDLCNSKDEVMMESNMKQALNQGFGSSKNHSSMSAWINMVKHYVLTKIQSFQ
jgi:hypothetical protein